MKTCIYCGSELSDDSVFCRVCGKKQGKPDGADLSGNTLMQEETPANRQGEETGVAGTVACPQPQAGGVYLPQNRPVGPKKERGGRAVDRVRKIFERYVLRAVGLAACFILFISGFFISIDYYEVSQVQQRIDISDTGEVSLSTLMIDMPIEQNVFNVFGAFFIHYDDPAANEEELNDLTEELTNKTQTIVAKYQKTIAKLTAEAEAGNNRAASQLVDLMYDIADEICSSVKNINVIKLDRLNAEIAYETTDSSQSETAGGYNDSQAAMLVKDLDFRTALLTLYVAGYLFLQVVSLVYLCFAAIDFFRKDRKKGIGKFFLLYLIGCFALFAAGQLTATSVNGVGIFCFVMAAILGAVYLGFSVFCKQRFGKENIMQLSFKGVAAALGFSALCVLTGNIFDFGVFIRKIGAVFGLYSFETNVDYYVDDLFTFGNFMGVAVPYLIVYVMLLIVFSKSLCMIRAGENAKAGLVLPILTSSFIVASYITLILLVSLGSPLRYVPEAFLVVFVLSIIVLICFVFIHVMCREALKKQRAGTQSASENIE